MAKYDETTIVCGCKNQKIYLINAEVGEIIKEFDGHVRVFLILEYFYYFNIFYIGCNFSCDTVGWNDC